GEGDLIVALQMLVGEDQQRILQPSGIQLTEAGVVELGDLHAPDHGAERGVERLDVERACHGRPPSVAGVLYSRSPPQAPAVVPVALKALMRLRPVVHLWTSSGPSTRRCERMRVYQPASGVSCE